jgi:U3 small nucleolar RNA-associated protein 14
LSLGAPLLFLAWQAQYEETSKAVTRWQPLVKANREAAQISFSAEAGADTRPTLTIGALTDKFKPTTDLEKEMAGVFKSLRQEDPGVGKDGLVDAEGLTKEELEKKQGEVAKLRALMSYHEKVKARHATH